MNLKEYYESYSKERGNYIARVPLDNVKRVNDLLPFLASPMLDVGCGTGDSVNYFSKKGFIVEGCDISENAIKKARNLFAKHNFFVHDFSLKSLNKKYNTVYAFDVIEHVFDYNSFLHNIWESLNNKGKLILATPNVCGLKSRIKVLLGNGEQFINFSEGKLQPHIRFFTVKTLKEVLEKNEFKVIKVFGYTSIPFNLSNNLCGSITAIAEKRTS
ncbi:MAG: class I SAM-dependent methyltransferase [archaeon]